ncbi:MAG: hypothetical protein ACM3JD_19945, partial [Rudaea sp.]
GDRIYQSPQRPGKAGASQLALTLAFDLPLTIGKSWCPQTPPPANPDCASLGRRTVEEKGVYTAPAGRFEDCFEIAEDFNSGGVTRWFCPGVGIVAQKYDHRGSRFGFEQVLIKYLKGSGS